MSRSVPFPPELINGQLGTLVDTSFAAFSSATIVEVCGVVLGRSACLDTCVVHGPSGAATQDSDTNATFCELHQWLPTRIRTAVSRQRFASNSY